MKKLITALAVAGLIVSGATAANAMGSSELREVWWIVPSGVSPVDNRVGEEGFPQKLTQVGVVPCGAWAQVDFYPAAAPVDEWTADGVLEYGEDWGWVEQGHVWDFIYGGDCKVSDEEPENPVVKETRTVQPTTPAEIQTARS